MLQFNPVRSYLLRCGIFAALMSLQSMPVLAQAPPSTTSQEQQAIDRLVRDGAVVLSRTDASGTKVVEVRLTGNKFDNSVIEQLRLFPYLETLRFLTAAVDDALVRQLDGFTNLRTLGFFGVPVTDAGLATLAQSKVGGEIRQLLLGRTKITDAGLKSVAAMQRLYLLELSGTGVTDAGIGELIAAKRLKVLRFRGTGITDKAIPSLGQLSSLMLISIGGSKVTEAGVAELRKKIPGLVVTDEEITLTVEER